MKQTISGTFVLQNFGNGCLGSKYVNNVMHTPLAEACKLFSGGSCSDPFIGHFKTTWIENMEQSIFADLIIRYAANSNDNSVYELSWREINGGPMFSGIGMIYENRLVGAYYSD